MRCLAQCTLPERVPIQTNRGLLQGHTSSPHVLRSEFQSAHSDATSLMCVLPISWTCSVTCYHHFEFQNLMCSHAPIHVRTGKNLSHHLFVFVFVSLTFDDMAVVTL